jgi:hypothetical protein
MQCACAVLYRHLWPVWLYIIFAHYLINRTIFEEKKFVHKMCFDFLYKFSLKLSHSKKNVNQTFRKKYSAIKFYESRAVGAE